jgi:2'-hydroxyisoflavone reductase
MLEDHWTGRTTVSTVRLLVLGGTAWLGRCIVATAVERGHDVTCVARGKSGDPPEGAVFVRADRSSITAYDEVASQNWDAVVDLARQPGHVRTAVEALVGRTNLIVFVSSCSVYADHSTPGAEEDAALLEPLQGDVMETMDSYGEAKVACEHHVLTGMGAERTLIARAGLIGGPGDSSDRSGYWPLRFSRPVSQDGAVLVPDASDLVAQVIDARDLASWIVDAAGRGVTGMFNATGESVAFPRYLETVRAVGGHSGPVVRADQQWLLSQGVQEWMGPRSLPLWLADPAWIGFNARDSSRACRAGLTRRPLRETTADTLAWELTRDRSRVRQAGLSDEDERDLLDRLAAVAD